MRISRRCGFVPALIDLPTLVRGGDLSTISRDDSVGSNPQDEESDALLEDDCALMSETLQIQLDRAVIRMVHGDETPAAYVVVNPPSSQDLTKDLAIDEGLARLGMKQDHEDLAQRYGRSISEEIEETTHLLDGDGREAGPAANEMDAIALSEWLFEIRQALASDLRPLGDALAEAMGAGDLPAMMAALKKISKGMPDLAGDAADLSAVLQRQFTEAFLEDEADEEAIAENVFDPSQPRDLMGRWNGSTGGSGNPAIGKTGSWEALGLESISAMRADPASTVSDVVRAKLALERGIPVMDHAGTAITFGPEILEHWQTEGKPPAEHDRRLRRLADAVRTVTGPHEVWEDPANGQKTYLRKYREGESSFTVSGFVADRSGIVRSYFHDRRNTSINKRRQGRLLHKR